MHELGIAQDLWVIIKGYAGQHNLKKVTRIVIAVGEASGIEEGFLRHSFVDHILPGSIAEGAELVLQPEKLIARCNECHKEITKDGLTSIHCPCCSSMKIDIIAGKETYVHSIEGM